MVGPPAKFLPIDFPGDVEDTDSDRSVTLSYTLAAWSFRPIEAPALSEYPLDIVHDFLIDIQSS